MEALSHDLLRGIELRSSYNGLKDAFSTHPFLGRILYDLALQFQRMSVPDIVPDVLLTSQNATYANGGPNAVVHALYVSLIKNFGDLSFTFPSTDK